MPELLSHSLTHHAGARCRQRGTPLRLLRLVLDRADAATHVGHGCSALSLTRDAGLELIAEGEHPDLVRQARRRVLVTSDGDALVTVLAQVNGRGRHYRRQGKARGRR